MTALLEKALAEVAKLPDKDQDAYARRLLEELEDEARWATSFAASQDLLAQMADEARAEIARGGTRPLEKLLNEPL